MFAAANIALRPSGSKSPLLLAVVVFLSFCGSVNAQAQFEEMAVELAYKRLVRTYVDALFTEEMQLLMPLAAVCEVLGVKHEFTSADSTITIERFWLNDKVQITPQGWSPALGTEFESHIIHAQMLDVYVDLPALEKILEVTTQFNFNELRLSFRGTHSFPIDAAAERRKRRRTLGTASEDAVAPDVVFSRTTRLFDAGFVNYNLQFGQSQNLVQGTGQSAASQDLSFSLETLGEMFGGDYNFSSVLLARSNDKPLFNFSGGWRLHLGESWLQQIRLGQFNINSSPLYGVRLSTQKLKSDLTFDEMTIEADCPNGWECEMYMDNQYIGMQRGDSTGLASFSMPLRYGSIRYELRRYSRFGERDTVHRSSFVPRDFVRRGKYDYRLTAGIDLDGGLLAQSRMRYGLTRQVTAALDLTSTSTDLFQPAALLWARLGDKEVLELRHDFLQETQLSLNSRPRRSMRLQSELRWLHNTDSRNGLRFLEGKLRASDAITLLGRNLGLELNATAGLTHSREQWAGLSTDARLTARYSIADLRLRASLRRRTSNELSAAASAYVNSELNCRLPLAALMPSFLGLGGVRAEAELHYNHSNNTIDQLFLALERSWRVASIRIAAECTYDLLRAEPRLGLRLNYDLDAFSTSVACDLNRTAAVSRLQLQGGLAMEGAAQSVWPSRRQMSSGAAVAVRFFRDRNADGIWNDGEETYNEAEVLFDQSVRMQRDESGVTRILDLLPYTEYRVRVSPTTLLDPLWAPAFREMSVITDPNRLKRIDIPMVPAAVLECSVNTPAGQAAAGLRFKILRAGTSRVQAEGKVYSDGLLYAAGLGPGDYNIEFDSAQLKSLGLALNSRSFNVAPNGGFVELTTIVLGDQ